MAEVGCGLHAVVCPAGGVDNVEAVVRRMHDGVQAVAGGDAGIVLRPPVYQVSAIGSGEERGTVVHLEHQPPGAVAGTAERGVVHTLLGTPRAVVAAAELTQVLPAVGRTHGGVQPLTEVGGIDEDTVPLGDGRRAGEKGCRSQQQAE